MATSAITSSAAGGTTKAAGTSGFGAIKSDDFIKVMLAELRNQDPFQPQDSGKLLEQMSSLRNIESQLSLQESLQGLVLQNQVSGAGQLIGKVVAGLDDNNDQVTGLVKSVRVQDGKALLELDSGKTLSLDRITEIAEAGSAAAA